MDFSFRFNFGVQRSRLEQAISCGCQTVEVDQIDKLIGSVKLFFLKYLLRIFLKLIVVYLLF